MNVDAMPEIFLSYAREDSARAERLAQALAAADLDVWWDRSLAPGHKYEDTIDAALEQVKCVVVLWSGASVKSDWVRVEAGEGLKARKLVPARLEQVRVPLSFRHLQTADLIGWPERQAGFDDLVRTIRKLVGTKRPAIDTGVNLFGRKEELRRLNKALNVTTREGGRIVTLSGEPGIGKTQLVMAFAGTARRSGYNVLVGNCYEEAGAPPYWPWTQILEGVQGHLAGDQVGRMDEADAELIASLVPSMGKRLGVESAVSLEDEASQTRFRLFTAVVGILVECAQIRPLVIIIDNLHWADRPSMRLLEFLARELVRHPILIVATYRDVEITRLHPLFETLGNLARETDVARIKLRGLSLTDSASIIRTVVAEPLPNSLVDEIYNQTEGNPLFVTEVARVLADELATCTDRVSVRIPDGVREAIGRRLNRLSQDCNQVLSEASVLGRTFTLALLRDITGLDQDTVVSRLDDAIAYGILEQTENLGTFQFTHAMIRSTLYEELPLSARLRLHRAAAVALESIPDSVPIHYSQIAQHYYVAAQGGDTIAAFRAARRAGHHARSILAFEEASKNYEMALDAAAMSSDDMSRECCEVALALVEARLCAGHPAPLDTLPIIRTAFDHASKACEPALMAHAAREFVHHSWSSPHRRHHQQSLDFLDEALHALDEDDLGERAMTLARKALILHILNRREDADSALDAAIDLARRCNDKAMASDTLSHCTAALRGRPEKLSERTALIDEALALARGDHMRSMLAIKLAVLCYQESANPDKVEELRSEIEVLAERTQYMEYLHFASSTEACEALTRGQWKLAQEKMDIALELGRGTADLAAEGIHGTQMFLLHRETGKLARFGPILERFLAEGNRPWLPGIAALYAALSRGRDLAQLLDEQGAGFEWVAEDELYPSSLALLSEAVCCLADASRAAELYRRMLPYAGQMIVHPTAVCYGPADLYLGMLALTMNRRDDALAHLDAALDFCTRARSRPWAVHVHYYRALALRYVDKTAAAASLKACRTDAEALGMADILEKLQSIDDVLPNDLTARELDVLRLIAMGRSNKDISTVLSISLSTVATHVRSILSKTATANRTEAAAYAREHGLDREVR